MTLLPANYPILKYDFSRQAITEPSLLIKPRDVPEHCVVCFFRDVLDEVVVEHDCRVIVENKDVLLVSFFV